MVLETEWGVWRNCCEVRASYLSLVSNLELQLGEGSFLGGEDGAFGRSCRVEKEVSGVRVRTVLMIVGVKRLVGERRHCSVGGTGLLDSNSSKYRFKFVVFESELLRRSFRSRVCHLNLN